VPIGPAVRVQVEGREVEPHHAAALADHVKLPVGQVARAVAKRVGVGMRGDERRHRDAGHVVEALLVQVRQVDQDAEFVAEADKVAALPGEAGPRIGRAGKGHRHAVAEDRGPAPDRAERPQAHVVEKVERVEVRADGLGALHVHDARDHARLHRGADLGHRTADAEIPGAARSIQCRSPAMASASGWACVCVISGGIGSA
jgi:hypothetical protein